LNGVMRPFEHVQFKRRVAFALNAYSAWILFFLMIAAQRASSLRMSEPSSAGVE